MHKDERARAIDAAIKAMVEKNNDPAWKGGLGGYHAVHGHAPTRPPCRCMLARWKELGEPPQINPRASVMDA